MTLIWILNCSVRLHVLSYKRRGVILTLSASLTWPLNGDKNSFTPRLPYCRCRILFETRVNYYTEATERRLAVCGDYHSRRFQFLPAAVFLNFVFSMSPRPKRLLLAKVITCLSISTLIWTKCVDTWRGICLYTLKTEAWKSRSMGILSVASV